MQATKDSFYVTLRDRLAQAYPARTITVDGITRPAIVVVENDKPSVTARQHDAFYLVWGEARAVQPAMSNLMAMVCSVSYASAGTEQNGGLDRGRAVAELESELLDICSPRTARKSDWTRFRADGSGVEHFLDRADVSRGGEPSELRGPRGSDHGLFLSRGEPGMSGNPYARQSQMWPLAEAVRAYVAPVDRTTGASRSV